MARSRTQSKMSTWWISGTDYSKWKGKGMRAIVLIHSFFLFPHWVVHSFITRVSQCSGWMTSSAPPLYYPDTFEIEEDDKPSQPPSSRHKREGVLLELLWVSSRFSSIISPLCCFLTSPFLLVLLFGVFSLLFFAYRNSSVDVNRVSFPIAWSNYHYNCQSRSFFGRFKVGGHRGVIGAQPENSIAAFQKV